MKKPEIEVVRFGAEDVIATSVLEWSDLGGTKGDSKVSFGSYKFGTDSGGNSDSEYSNIVDALGNYYGWTGTSTTAQNVWFYLDHDTTSYKTLAALWLDEKGAWTIPTNYNGFYTFDTNSGSGQYRFYHQ